MPAYAKLTFHCDAKGCKNNTTFGAKWDGPGDDGRVIRADRLSERGWQSEFRHLTWTYWCPEHVEPSKESSDAR